ncbi:MAG: BatA and WFA domain-containing protein [Planctomycetota bacterium]
MSLLSPGFLFAAVLALPLVAIFLLKVRPRRAPVTAYFLWDRVFVEKQSSAFFRKLRDVLSLALLLLALAACVFAASRPVPTDADDRDLLVVIDDSVSMTAGVGNGSAFDAAKAEARGLLTGISDERRGAIATMSDAVRMQRFLTTEPASLRKQLDALEPSWLPTDASAATVLQGLDGFADSLRTVVLTDASPETLGLPDDVGVISVAASGERDNAGFIAADLQLGADGDEVIIFFQLAASASLAEQSGEVVVSRDGRAIKIIPVTLAAGEASPIITTAAGGPGVYQLELALDDRPSDAMPSDNRVQLIAREPQPIRVAVPPASRFFFENAIIAFEQSEGIVRLTPEVRADIRLERGSDVPPADARLGAIVFALEPGSRWAATVGDELAAPIPRIVAQNHPALRFIPIESLTFTGARAVTLATGTAVLVEDQAGNPLVWQRRALPGDDTPSGLVFNMDPSRGDFFLSPYFPLLVRGATAYLGGRSDEPRAVFPTGAAVALPGLTPDQSGTITNPNTNAAETPAAVRTVAFGDRTPLTEPGIYDIDASGIESQLAAAVLHRGETITNAATDLPQLVELARGAPWWVKLAAVAVLLLIAEEALYHTRKVG